MFDLYRTRVNSRHHVRTCVTALGQRIRWRYANFFLIFVFSFKCWIKNNIQRMQLTATIVRVLQAVLTCVQHPCISFLLHFVGEEFSLLSLTFGYKMQICIIEIANRICDYDTVLFISRNAHVKWNFHTQTHREDSKEKLKKNKIIYRPNKSRTNSRGIHSNSSAKLWNACIFFVQQEIAKCEWCMRHAARQMLIWMHLVVFWYQLCRRCWCRVLVRIETVNVSSTLYHVPHL